MKSGRGRQKGRQPRKRGARSSRKWRVFFGLVVLCGGVWWWSRESASEKNDQAALEQVSLNKLKKRGAQGDGAAQLELAEKYCLGKGVRKNKFQCAEWYRKAANLGSGIAMLRLGDMYATGEGFILDKDAALMWWRKAASTADGATGAAKRLPSSPAPPGR